MWHTTRTVTVGPITSPRNNPTEALPVPCPQPVLLSFCADQLKGSSSFPRVLLCPRHCSFASSSRETGCQFAVDAHTIELLARFAIGSTIVRNKLAVLITLAKRPEGRASLDELADEVALLIAETDKKVGNGDQLRALDHIDIFQSGLVASEDDSLWITENGWSLLHALGISAQGWPDPDFASTSQSLNLIDDLIGTEARLKIFDRVSRSIDQSSDRIPPRDETTGLEAPSRISRPDDPRLPAGSNDHAMDRDRRAAISNEASAHHRNGEIASDAPAFLIRKFGSGLRGASASSNPLSKLTQRVRQGIGIWRRHLQQDQPPKETRRSGANMERGLFALLSLLAIVSCAGAVAALIQVKSLKSPRSNANCFP